MTLSELTPPAGEPLTLAEAKAHLRLDTNDEDQLIAALILTVRQHLERQTGLALITRTARLYLDDWPDNRIISLPIGPVTAIQTVTVYDSAGLPRDIGAQGFVLDGRARPARLLVPVLAPPEQAINGIEIDMIAGFGATGAEVHDALKRAMLLHLALLFAFRGVVAPDDQPAGIPLGYDRLIAPYLIRRL
ncbi:hypothetical protein BJF93_19390 [Xaviernesmea oryzae]|uniref:PhiE125 gp8 family phage protein n=1 Tax=Xaviernesmea oryzae TaxID=464029 RepID=A0A1Q9B1G0_9HYPH|nr:head-tail connector protein [Xaviernesmea oryzae]OLP61851.1 hypothetical protein BJF93_19390 [Xaviernesmea oryzae]SEL75407.1 phage conserved hypothetical protein, phiE125 gp8 family [Xaviernesmea oryzae]